MANLLQLQGGEIFGHQVAICAWLGVNTAYNERNKEDRRCVSDVYAISGNVKVSHSPLLYIELLLILNDWLRRLGTQEQEEVCADCSTTFFYSDQVTKKVKQCNNIQKMWMGWLNSISVNEF